MEEQQNDGTVWSTTINRWVTPAQLEVIATCGLYSEELAQDGRPAFVRICEQEGTRGDLEFLVPGDYVWDGESEVWKHPDLLGTEVAQLLQGIHEANAEAVQPTVEAAPPAEAAPAPDQATTAEEKPKRKLKKKEPEVVASDREIDYTITIDMINRQMLQNDSRVIHRRCLLADSTHSTLRSKPEKEFYWAEEYSGYTTREKAPIRTVGSVVRYLGSGDYVLEVLKDPGSGKRSSIASFFTENFLNLIQLTPANPIVRAQIMRQLLKEPPKEAKTYEEVKEWVETNFEDVFTPPNVLSKGNNSIHAILTIPVRISRDEFGSANYSVRQRMTSNVSLSVSQMTEWLDEGLTLDDIIRRIKEITEDVDFEVGHEEDYKYDDHEVSDHDNYTHEITEEGRARESILSFVMENIGEESAEELENR